MITYQPNIVIVEFIKKKHEKLVKNQVVDSQSLSGTSGARRAVISKLGE